MSGAWHHLQASVWQAFLPPGSMPRPGDRIYGAIQQCFGYHYQGSDSVAFGQPVNSHTPAAIANDYIDLRRARRML
jgi:hypothetical protein